MKSTFNMTAAETERELARRELKTFELFWDDRNLVIGPFRSTNDLLLFARDHKLTGYRYRACR